MVLPTPSLCCDIHNTIENKGCTGCLDPAIFCYPVPAKTLTGAG